MKKIFYGITLFCLMFSGIASVMAAGSVDISTTTLTIEEGGTATFNFILDNAIAAANINSTDTAVATVNPSGTWVSDMNGAGKTQNVPFTVTAVGAAGTSTTITIEIYDASTYDVDPVKLATKTNKVNKTINVSIVAKGGGSAVVEPTSKYVVTYNANGGKSAPANQSKDAGAALTLSSTKPTRDKYEFIGWNTKADGSGKSYDAGSTYTADENVTLYAQWKAIGNVTTNPDTGDSAMIIVLAIAITFGGYSYWYTKKAKEN